MTPFDIYCFIGLFIVTIWCIGTIIAVVRYAFHCINTNYPKPSTIMKVPGFGLLGENGSSWIEVALINIVICIPIVFVGIMLWPISLIMLIQAVITTARKKRFGND